jgi:hypothetical protein
VQLGTLGPGDKTNKRCSEKWEKRKRKCKQCWRMIRRLYRMPVVLPPQRFARDMLIVAAA